MNKFNLTGAMIALLATACNDAKTAPAATIQVTTNATTQTIEPKSGTALTKEFMTGKWTEAGDADCKLAQDFKADGSVDGFFESWKLEGDKLVATVAGESMTMAVTVIDAKTIEIVSNGKPQRLVRC